MRLIDADALKEQIKDKTHYLNYEYANQKDVIDMLDNAPTVEPEITEKQAILLLINNGWLVNHDKELREKWARPHGEWIFRQDPIYGGYYKCSECGEVEKAEKKFCSNCGADMRGEKE